MTAVQDHQTPRCSDGSCTGNGNLRRTFSCAVSIVQEESCSCYHCRSCCCCSSSDMHVVVAMSCSALTDSGWNESAQAWSTKTRLLCQMWLSGRSMGNEFSPLKSGPSACSSRSTHREVYSFTGALSNLLIASAASVLQ